MYVWNDWVKAPREKIKPPATVLSPPLARDAKVTVPPSGASTVGGGVKSNAGGRPFPPFILPPIMFPPVPRLRR